MKVSIIKIVILSGMLNLLCACGSFPINPVLTQYEANKGYRFSNLEKGDNSDNLFIVVTFSGGGTRAAALAFGTLKGLRDNNIHWQGKEKPLLDEVDVISSVSGGSFTAVYYGLFGERLFTEFPGIFLNRPVEDKLVAMLFSPTNLFKLAGRSFGRSDLAAELYDREIFKGATYKKLIARNKRPFIVVNATDMSLGAPFSFTQDQFDVLCSDLAGVPIARAVAASSAFPGLLTPLTFKNYAGKCQYQHPSWVALAMKDRQTRINLRRTARAENLLSYTRTGETRRDFIHLTDGGVADNIGLRGPFAAIDSVNHPWSILQFINNKKINRLVVIVVNAATSPLTARDRTDKVPGTLDVLKTAATVPMNNYSFDTLDLLKIRIDELNSDVSLVESCKKLAARQKPPCNLQIRSPHRVEFYPVRVDFDSISDARLRGWFKNLPTTFQLPKETVNKLIAAGQDILLSDPQFRRLMRDIGITP